MSLDYNDTSLFNACKAALEYVRQVDDNWGVDSGDFQNIERLLLAALSAPKGQCPTCKQREKEDDERGPY